jgi:hypothetical protein
MNGFKKMDEFELMLSYKSIKYTWMYTLIFLIIWTIYDYITKGEFGLSFFLLATQYPILAIIQFCMKRKYK